MGTMGGALRTTDLSTAALRLAHAQCYAAAMHEIHVAQAAAIPLAVIPVHARAADLKRLIPENCGIVWNAMRAQQVRAGRHVAIYWDDAMHVDIGVEVFTPFTDSGEVVHAATPAGIAAWTTHLGPYGGLGAAHEAI